MSKPIKTTSSKIDAAPTPHNTPSSVLGSSYLKNGNPARNIPQTINEEEINSALANNPQLLASIQDKLGDLVGQDSGYVASLPGAVRDRIYALKKLQRDLFEMEKEFQLEMFALEEKYLKKYAPVHQRRFEIVTGKQEPTAQEIEAGKDEGDQLDTLAEEPEEDEEGADNAAEDLKGIPSFWLTAFENLPIMSQTVTSADAEVLEFLTDVKLEYLTEGKPGFKLVFEFDPENPFFSNSQLVKTYYYQSELGYSGDFIYDHAEGCKIDWTDNESNVTISVEKRKQRNKTTKQVRTIEKITPVESFFNFFDPPKLPAKAKDASGSGDENEDDDEDEEDDEEVAELESRLALDYAIGEEFKDKLIPRAVDWFTGAAIEFEYDADQPDDEEFDSELDDDEEDDDEDDDEDGDDDGSENDFASAAPGTKEQPPECKQN
ncbi:histone chaperone NAP1 [Lachancea thermotolerans CBS 6340]|uniref:KLTH0F06160p n=1 Tax=Lachancea thermotolerans (strain ATCC 56472 / CBS 6340 / NRRL Y-8284) TaxID=559295 RepID=C5DKN5_LACTC|nr:KLTH0F06160p [Lachancea thermotolerans CBS 6340]CAR24036.1 KLTH0F06160p [Lachancea thermotolerans CBS 6340]